MRKFLEKLFGLFEFEDPVKHCEFYKQNDCAYVDGPYCPFPNYCNISDKSNIVSQNND